MVKLVAVETVPKTWEMISERAVTGLLFVFTDRLLSFLWLLFLALHDSYFVCSLLEAMVGFGVTGVGWE
mgnify:CR=1 FL=1